MKIKKFIIIKLEMNFSTGRLRALAIHKTEKVIRAKTKVFFHPVLRLNILVNNIAEYKTAYKTSTILIGNRGMIKMANIINASCNI